MKEVQNHEENRCHQLQSPFCLEHRNADQESHLDAGIALAHLYVANEDTFQFFKTENATEVPGYVYIGSCTI